MVERKDRRKHGKTLPVPMVGRITSLAQVEEILRAIVAYLEETHRTDYDRSENGDES
jgi:hypothetical protein